MSTTHDHISPLNDLHVGRQLRAEWVTSGGARPRLRWYRPCERSE
ncbi:MAG: hypothetical protein AAF945_00815 [Actinomycetota bacterium]